MEQERTIRIEEIKSSLKHCMKRFIANENIIIKIIRLHLDGKIWRGISNS